jgi:hypothetical protein
MIDPYWRIRHRAATPDLQHFGSTWSLPRLRRGTEGRVLEGRLPSAHDVILEGRGGTALLFYLAKSGSGAPLGPGRTAKTLPDSG